MANIYTVSQVNNYIKAIIAGDMILSDIWIQGEISNLKLHYSGHAYFTLKDNSGVIKSVMFSKRLSTIRFKPEDGMKVIARGNISVFERDGQYQFYVDSMQPDGSGALYLAFEQLKKKLEAEGLFDLKIKKKLPLIPRSVGVITSKTGSVIKDIINITYRRFPDMKLQIYPVAVQGEDAAQQIANALNFINKNKSCDVVILARGGGSIEELWAFNEEITARAIASCQVPVVSAVGHETDFVISDFVADLRAPTPSAAAELVIPDKQGLKAYLQELEIKISSIPKTNLRIKRAELDTLKASHVFKRPLDRIMSERQYINNNYDKLINIIRKYQEKGHTNLSLACTKLQGLSPLNILSRGYNVAETEDGQVITSIQDIETGDKLKIIFKDGEIISTIDNITGGDINEKIY